MTSQSKKLSDFLPYDSYDEKTFLYTMKDGSVGFAFEILPMVYPSTSTASILEALLALLPTDSSVSVLAYGSPHIAPTIERWKNIDTGDHAFLSAWKKKYAKFLVDSTYNQVTPASNACMRDIRVFLSVRLHKHEPGKTPFAMLSKMFGCPEENPSLDTKTQEEEAAELRCRIADTLISGDFCFCDLTPDALTKLLYEVFNPSHNLSQNMPLWDKALPISKQVIAPGTTIGITEDHIEIDGVFYRSLSVKDYPSKFHISFMDDLLGHSCSNNYQFSSPFFVCFNGVKAPPELVKRFKKTPVVFGKTEPDDDANDKTDRLEPLVYSSLNLIVSGRTKNEIKDNSECTAALWLENRYCQCFSLLPDKYIHLPVFMSCLPLYFDKDVNSNLGRSHLWFADTAASFFPVSGDSKGSSTPTVPLVSRRGQLMGFDFFDSKTNPNSFIVGASGSGKSFFVNHLAMNYLASGAQVFIFDDEQSHEGLLKVCNGQKIIIDPKNPISLNPFSVLESREDLDESLDYLVEMVFSAGASLFPAFTEEAEAHIKVRLANAIVSAYEGWGSDISISHVLLKLRPLAETDSRLCDFILYCDTFLLPDNVGPFFFPESKIDFTSPLVVIERDSLIDTKLHYPLMMAINFHISHKIKSLNKRKGSSNSRSLVFMDGAHRFLGNPNSHIFLEHAYRRFRRAGAGICTITQSFNDLYVPGKNGVNASLAGRVIIENSAFKFFLSQTSESLQALEWSKQVPLERLEYNLMRSLCPVKGQYSEIFACTPWGFSVLARHIPDRFFYYLHTRDKNDKDRVNQKVSEGLDLTRAIEAVIAEDLAQEGCPARFHKAVSL